MITLHIQSLIESCTTVNFIWVNSAKKIFKVILVGPHLLGRNMWTTFFPVRFSSKLLIHQVLLSPSTNDESIHWVHPFTLSRYTPLSRDWWVAKVRRQKSQFWNKQLYLLSVLLMLRWRELMKKLYLLDQSGLQDLSEIRYRLHSLIIVRVLPLWRWKWRKSPLILQDFPHFAPLGFSYWKARVRMYIDM